MRELLLKIRALLINLSAGGRPALAPAAAVALALMETGDLYAGTDSLMPVGDVLPDQPEPGYAHPMLAAGAACALKRLGQDGVAVAAVRADEAFFAASDTAVHMNLPVIFLAPVRERDLETLSERAMDIGLTNVPADGRDVMHLMPAIRSALDSAREGDGPALIECVVDRPAADDAPDDPIGRLDQTLLLEGYVEPEELV